MESAQRFVNYCGPWAADVWGEGGGGGGGGGGGRKLPYSGIELIKIYLFNRSI